MPEETAAPKKAVSKERMTVTLDGLQEEFGIKEGLAKYCAIAKIEGETINKFTGETERVSYFFDPAREAANFKPELVIATLPGEARKKVADIISSTQGE